MEPPAALDKLSEYFCDLSGTAKARYQSKILCTGLLIDPYAIADCEWTRHPAELPRLTWSDVTVYMTITPSPYTNESVKVKLKRSCSAWSVQIIFIGLERYARL